MVTSGAEAPAEFALIVTAGVLLEEGPPEAKYYPEHHLQ